MALPIAWIKTVVQAVVTPNLLLLSLAGAPVEPGQRTSESAPALLVEVDGTRRIGVLTSSALSDLPSTRQLNPNHSLVEVLSTGPRRFRLTENSGSFVLDEHELLHHDIHRFAGYVEGSEPSRVVLMLRGEMLAGTFQSHSGMNVRILPLGGGWHQTEDLRSQPLPACGLGFKLNEEQRSSWMVPPSIRRDSTRARPLAIAESIMDREIELMVVYSAHVRRAASGTDALELVVNVAIAEANAAFKDSGTGVRLRLVNMSEVDYTESGDLGVDLAKLRSDGDGLLDEIHAWRDAHDADLVCLIVEKSTQFEGIATFPTGLESGFLVVDRFHLTGYGLLAHEIGHNFGCDHDRENATGGGAFPYSYGHRLESNGETYRTIMSYAPGWPISNFSNPSILFQGMPTGVPAGEPEEADNARTIRQMAALIDGYRGLNVTLTATGGNIFDSDIAVEFTAQVNSREGPVETVQFFNGSLFLGEARSAPYMISWVGPEPGRHLIKAVALLESGVEGSDQLVVGIRPSNDHFAHRQPLTGSNVVTSAVLFAASTEPGEPMPYGSVNASTWWTWTSPMNGTARVWLTDAGLPPSRIAIFKGNDLRNLQLVTKSSAVQPDILFHTTTGEEFHLVLQGKAHEHATTLHISMQEPPPNDDFSQAQQLNSEFQIIRASTVAATREEDEPAIGPMSFGHSVWFAWTPPAPGQASIVATSDIALLDLAVFTGESLTSLQLVATTGPAGEGFTILPDTVYWIGVDGPFVELTLTVSLTRPPPNDSFNRRTSAFTGSLLAINNAGASSEPGEPVHTSARGGRSQWWTFRAPSDGGIRFSRSITSPMAVPQPFTVAVYHGSALTNLTLLGAHDFLAGFQESFVLPVRRNTNYSIAIDGRPMKTSSGELRFEFRGKAVNDNFRQRQLSPAFLRTIGTTLGATAETGEPHHAGLPPTHSTWVSWTSLSEGLAAATISGSGPETPRLAIYSGIVLTNLILIADNTAPNGFTSTVLFRVEANKPYLLAVDEAVSTFSYSLSVNPVSAPVNDGFAERTPVPAVLQYVQGSTLGASSEANEPAHLSDGTAGPSVWFTWLPPVSGKVALIGSGRIPVTGLFSDVRPNLSEPFMAVYTGDDLADLQLVGKGLGSTVFEAVRNRPYQIAVTAQNGRAADFHLSLSGIPKNDEFRSANSLFEAPSSTFATPLQFQAATREPGEPAHGGFAEGHSLWWTLIPRRSGMFVFTVQQSRSPYSAPIRLTQAVYTGTNVVSLNHVGSSDTGSLPLSLQSGTRYYFAVDLQEPGISLAAPTSGSILLNLQQAPAAVSPKLRLPDTIEFQIAGGIGQRLLLQTSRDLTNWVAARTIALPSTEYRFLEGISPGTDRRFYRVLQAPP